LFAPAQVVAQDCGHDCHACPLGLGYEGINHEDGGPFNMTCFMSVPYCVACAPQDTVGGWPIDPETRVSDVTPGAEMVVKLIYSVPAERLNSSLRIYRNRILVVPDRNLVVVKGNGCDPEALSTVLFVTSRKIKALRNMGVLTLTEYLRSRM
jgi:hypothetical protein